MAASPSSGSSLVWFAALAALSCRTQAAGVATATPVSRVISLLGKLEAQIQQEGAKEAAEYDKAACYCKDEADKTLYAIEKSKAKIEALTESLAKLDADIKELDGDEEKKTIGSIKTLKNTIDDKEATIDKITDKRAKAHEKHVAKAEEIADAIGGLEASLADMTGTKGQTKNAKLNLLQDKLLGVLSDAPTPPSKSELDAVMSLAQAPPSPQKNHASVYKSNSIIGTLDKLLASFKEQKKAANMEEKDKIFAHESKKLALDNQIDSLDKEKTQQEKDLAELQEEHATQKRDKEAEEQALKSDEGYLKEMTASCEGEARQFDQRSTTRSDELTAIGQAMSELKGGVKANYGSNTLAAGASFLQLNGGGSAVVAKAVALVSGEAKRLKSSSLLGLALKLNIGGNHFKKVVGLIKDLIKKLEDEAAAAAKSKSNCDSDMKKAVAKRDDSKLKMEDQGATIAMKTAEKVKLASEIQKLTDETADLQKAMLERTELRSEEKANNEATLAEAKEGKEAVDTAIGVLNAFYSSLLQKSNKAISQVRKPATNRHGDKVFDGSDSPMKALGDYGGKKEASKGIIGTLEVIASDFERTLSNVKDNESEGAKDFKEFSKQTNTDISSKRALTKEKEDGVKSATAAVTKAKDDKADAEELMQIAVEELEEISAMCLTGEGTFAERKKQREDEIKALQGCMKILTNWKDF